jgi:hypothetical protein
MASARRLPRYAAYGPAWTGTVRRGSRSLDPTFGSPWMRSPRSVRKGMLTVDALADRRTRDRRSLGSRFRWHSSAPNVPATDTVMGWTHTRLACWSTYDRLDRRRLSRRACGTPSTQLFVILDRCDRSLYSSQRLTPPLPSTATGVPFWWTRRGGAPTGTPQLWRARCDNLSRRPRSPRMDRIARGCFSETCEPMDSPGRNCKSRRRSWNSATKTTSPTEDWLLCRRIGKVGYAMQPTGFAVHSAHVPQWSTASPSFQACPCLALFPRRSRWWTMCSASVTMASPGRKSVPPSRAETLDNKGGT